MSPKTEKKQYSFMQYLLAMMAACLVFAIMQGIHDNYGIMLNGIVAHTGIDYASVSFVIAVGQILYGATQPIFGMLALKKSNAFVMMCGIVFMAVGLIVTPFCSGWWSLLIFFGILLPAGTVRFALGLLWEQIAPIIGEKRAAVASGIIQASAGIGDALIVAFITTVYRLAGVSFSMPVFAIPILLMLPVVFWLGNKRKKIKADNGENLPDEPKSESLSEILHFAMRDLHLLVSSHRIFNLWFSHGNYRNTPFFTVYLLWDTK
mgnify:CR=1 FL=1